MNLQWPIAANTVVWVAGVCGGLAVLAYILKLRRRRFEVPFSTLWHRVLREKEASSLWKHLKRILSLLLLLLILGSLLFAVLDPHLGEADKDARNVVVILDASASMKTMDGDDDNTKTRLTVAKEKARELLDSMGGSDTAMLMRMDGQTTPLSRFDTDKPRLKRRLESIVATDTPADLRRALSAAADALRERQNPLIVIIGDGAYQNEVLRSVVWSADELEEKAPDAEDDDADKAGDANATDGATRAEAEDKARRDAEAQKRLAAIDMTGMDVRYIPVGHAENNMGIVAFNVRRYITNKMSYEVFIEVQNFGHRPTVPQIKEAVAPRVTDADEARAVTMYLARKYSGIENDDELAAEFNVEVGEDLDALYEAADKIDDAMGDSVDYEQKVEAIADAIAPKSHRKLTLYNGGLAVQRVDIALRPGESERRIYPDVGGGSDYRLRALLAPGEGERGRDLFPLDDEAFALLPVSTKQNVLLVTADNLYLEAAMLVYDNLVVDKVLPEEYESMISKGQVEEYSAVVYDNYTPEELPRSESVNLLYFNPQGENSPFPIAREVRRPRITELNENHLVMRWLTLSDVNFTSSSVFEVDRIKGEVWLGKYVRDTVIAAKRDGRRKIVACGFGLDGTDLMLRVAFPMMLVNTLEWFAGDDSDLITTYKSGHTIRVPMDGTFNATQAQVKSPSGKKSMAPLVDGHATFYSSEIGIHEVLVEEDGQVVAHIDLAANLANPTESDIAPSDLLALGDKPLDAPEEFTITHRQAIWLYIMFFVLLLLVIEWITYQRRITV